MYHEEYYAYGFNEHSVAHRASCGKVTQVIGHRLARRALQHEYGLPERSLRLHYQPAQIDNNCMLIHVDDAVIESNPRALIDDFQIADADQHFHWASAELVSSNTIIFFAKNVPFPLAVRYGWGGNQGPTPMFTAPMNYH